MFVGHTHTHTHTHKALRNLASEVSGKVSVFMPTKQVVCVCFVIRRSFFYLSCLHSIECCYVK